MNRDVGFVAQSVRHAQIYSAAGANVQMYHLDVDMRKNVVTRDEIPYGTGHGDDLAFVFGFAQSEIVYAVCYPG